MDEASAAPILDNTERSGIAAGHREMCRFDKASTGYRTVVAAVRRYALEAPSTIAFRWVKARERLRVERVNEASELIGFRIEGLAPITRAATEGLRSTKRMDSFQISMHAAPEAPPLEPEVSGEPTCR